MQICPMCGERSADSFSECPACGETLAVKAVTDELSILKESGVMLLILGTLAIVLTTLSALVLFIYVFFSDTA